MPATAAQRKYQELRNKIAEAKRVMEETAKGLFAEMSAELFNENPTLTSFGWNQYTPYFNDGDECVFRCNGSYPTVSMAIDGDVLSYDSNSGDLEINGEEVRSQETYVRVFKDMFKGMKGGAEAASIIERGKTVSYDPATGDVTKDGVKVKSHVEYRSMLDGLEKTVSTFMDTFEDEDMKVMFGDHVQVVVHRDGKIETEEYSHD